MFTIEQIKTIHNKVKSGADFPSFIQEIKKLGVTHYETFVSDGHTDYYGDDGYSTSSEAMYPILFIDNKSNEDGFKLALKAHQQGKTNYPSFCNDCAKSGIEKWKVSIEMMTCTYYDRAGNEVLKEEIPQ